MEQHLRTVASELPESCISESRSLQFLDELVDSIARRARREKVPAPSLSAIPRG
jgi:hypothetical protein